MRALGFTDPEFYELETKVLERLRNHSTQAAITSACKEFNLDPFDFKDRWGPMLRNHSSMELIENITAIRPRLGDQIPDIAKDLGLPFGTVRTIVKKLLVTPESPHQRTKENLAHRMMASSGGSLRDAKAQIGKTPVPRRDNNEESESSSSESSEAEEAPKKVVKIDRVPAPAERKTPKPRPLGTLWYEQTLALLSGLEPMDGIPLKADVQVRVLEDMHKGTDMQKACQKAAVDYATFKAMWGQIVRLVPGAYLDATLYAMVSLSRMGYACCKISDVLGLTRNFTFTVLSNLHLELGPNDCSSFDVTMLLVNKEMLTGSRISELCKTPVDIGKAVVKRGGERDKYVTKVQDTLADEDISEAFLWLYERGLNLAAICVVMRLPKGMMRALLGQEEI